MIGFRRGLGCRVKSASLLASLALGCTGTTNPSSAETVTISVDGAAPGTPLERVWAFHGYDELNYSTAPEGKALLATLAALHSAPVHVPQSLSVQHREMARRR